MQSEQHFSGFYAVPTPLVAAEVRKLWSDATSILYEANSKLLQGLATNHVKAVDSPLRKPGVAG